MEHIINLLKNCKERGITLTLDELGTSIAARGNIGELLSDEKEYISKNKLEIIEFLKGIKNNISIKIPIAKTQTYYPLSSAQKRLWILSQQEKGSIAYNVPLAFELAGPLNIDALTSAFDLLIERHESLRTVFQENNGQVFQVIRQAENSNFKLVYNDLSKDENNSLSIKELVQKDFLRPFDLKSDLLLRAHLYQTKKDHYIFVLVIHHIISDGWSMKIFIKELLSYYEAINKNDKITLPPLNIHYKDYAVWEQEQSTLPSINEHRAYWLEKFKGELPVLAFLGDRLRPKIRSYKGATVKKVIPGGLYTSFHTLVKENESTLFMGLLAGINTLIYRYTGQEDIVIGSPVAGREYSDLKDQIGFYVNTLALRNEFKGDKSYLELLNTVRTTTIGAYEHQALPFNQLLESLNYQMDSSRNPLFDVWAVLHHDDEVNFTNEQLKLTNLEISKYSVVEDSQSRRDLTFNFIESKNGIELDLGYNSDIYDENTIDQFANHFLQILQEIVKNPTLPIQDLDYLYEFEKKEILIDFNESILNEDAERKTFIERFEGQVEQSPENLALIFGDVSLTYKELNERANQLGNYLTSKYEITKNTCVGILLDRSEWMIVSILAILKQGGAYLPIEADYPKERIEYILQDSNCKVLIDEKEIGEFYSEKNSYSKDNFNRSPSPEDLAYVIYTSGSTGNPKGVMISHFALMDYVNGILRRTNMKECKTFGLVSTVAADLGNTVIYPSLVLGGTLHIFTKNEITSPKEMSKQNLDCLKIVPSHWKALQENDLYFAPKKCLIFGGEALTTDVIEQLAKKAYPEQVYNHYGPSETTIGKLISQIDKDNLEEKISLGTPIGNNQVYILDEKQKVVPKGVVGEIFISGDGLSNGYLGKPILTNEKFIPNPFYEGKQMYRTGDRGRMLFNLKIEFIGRLDDQIKIRGYRIELGEIEKTILQYSEIISAVVLAKKEEEGIKLIAFVVGSPAFNTLDLRAFLEKKLPEHMIPAFYVELDEIPLTANGKIDKKALAIPDSLFEIKKGIIVPAATDIQKNLVGVWSEVLGINPEEISITDNFFDLGGHSLNAIKIVFRINEEYEVDLDLSLLFEEPTIERFSTELENILWLQTDKTSNTSLNTTII